MADRRTIRLAAAATLPLALGLWFALVRLLPPIGAAPMAFALGLTGAVVLLAFLPVIEAVAHERLMSDAIDPLAGKDSKRLEVNRRVLTNTLEQLAVFVPGLFLVAHDAGDLRYAAASAVLWVIGRWLFWIGYHIGPMWRGLGVFSLVQGLLTLAYGVGAFGYGLAGWPGAAVPIALFLAIEGALFVILRRPPRA